jgi:DNA-binding transcriptional ArsR family regulator
MTEMPGDGGDSDDVVELGDARTIRAVAHPARLVVIEALYDRGLALTATSAAEIAGITPSAMSYHLRALERYGIVRRADATGDGRERPWVRAAKHLRVRPDGAGSDRAMAVATGAVLSTALDVLRERLLLAIDRNLDPRTDDQPLDRVTQFTSVSVVVTADEAAALTKTIQDAIEPLRPENRKNVPEHAGSMSIVIAAYPDATPGHRPTSKDK